MRIDPTNYSVELKQSEALHKQRQIEFDGASKLRTQGYRAESELASAAAALATAEANLVRAQRNLERTYIRLPYEGIVRAKETDLGQFVNPGTRLGVVFATNHAEVRLPLTDSDLAFVDMPSVAEITDTGIVDGPEVTLSATQKGEKREWTATIIRTEGVVDENSRVTYAVARIDDPYRLHTDGRALPIGTFVAAVIEGISAVDVIRVPRSIVRGSDQLIFVDDENALRIRTVDVVRADANAVYLVGGATPGERVISSGLNTPLNGMSVRIRGEVDEALKIVEIASSTSEKP
jgi:multidrug efflux pump subunit AcrA (membrane-fusion protein)